jgi:hypothetical protein
MLGLVVGLPSELTEFGSLVQLLEEFTRAAPNARICRYFMLVLTRPSGWVGAFE